MDAQAYWQENKSFLLAVAGGVLVFCGAWWGIERSAGARVRAQSLRISRASADLRKEMYGAAELERVEAENAALREALQALTQAAEFEVRERFAASSSVSAESRYLSTVHAVREELLQLAGRAGASLPKDLGLPAQAPTRSAELARTLECFDAVDRFVRHALDCGIARVEELKIGLDARVRSGKPIADLEQNVVRAKAVGRPGAVAQLLTALATDRYGDPLCLGSVSVMPSRSKLEEVTLELELLVLHPHGAQALLSGDGSAQAPEQGRRLP